MQHNVQQANIAEKDSLEGSNPEPNAINNDSTALAVNAEAVLDFVCKLTQTVLKKSELSLVIVDDNTARLQILDKQLWSFEASSFIPHTLLLTAPKQAVTNSRSLDCDISSTPQNNMDNEAVESNVVTSHIEVNSSKGDGLEGNESKENNMTPQPTLESNTQVIEASMLSAPVSLVSALPQGFDGVVLNLAGNALPLKALAQQQNACMPERILEIITPDETSKQQGRDKYRYYRDLGYELQYFPIK